MPQFNLREMALTCTRRALGGMGMRPETYNELFDKISDQLLAALKKEIPQELHGPPTVAVVPRRGFRATISDSQSTA